eukprot:274393-Hanusia_phi.AAC.2
MTNIGESVDGSLISSQDCLVEIRHCWRDCLGSSGRRGHKLVSLRQDEVVSICFTCLFLAFGKKISVEEPDRALQSRSMLSVSTLTNRK